MESSRDRAWAGMTKEGEEEGPDRTRDKEAEGSLPWALRICFVLNAPPVT